MILCFVSIPVVEHTDFGCHFEIENKLAHKSNSVLRQNFGGGDIGLAVNIYDNSNPYFKKETAVCHRKIQEKEPKFLYTMTNLQKTLQERN